MWWGIDLTDCGSEPCRAAPLTHDTHAFPKPTCVLICSTSQTYVGNPFPPGTDPTSTYHRQAPCAPTYVVRRRATLPDVSTVVLIPTSSAAKQGGHPSRRGTWCVASAAVWGKRRAPRRRWSSPRTSSTTSIGSRSHSTRAERRTPMRRVPGEIANWNKNRYSDSDSDSDLV